MIELASQTMKHAWLDELASIKSRCDQAAAQLTDAQLMTAAIPGTNSVAVIMRHLAGSFRSRFTDFRTSDGEKHDRNRDGEFSEPLPTRAQLVETWDAAFKLVASTIESITEDDFDLSVTIRGETHTVPRAIERAINHASYHCGQILLLARLAAGPDASWKWITVAPNASAQFNESMRSKHVR
ncbi:MAG: DUF1572 family protein [Planctomycetota bacterium]|nr:DUF1572 family protein [Planctomycetota bacterium]